MAGEVFVQAGGLFLGLGLMVVMFVVAYMFYQVARGIKTMIDKDEKYELFEEMLVDKVAKKKGIDLNKELMKRNVFKQQRKSLRRKLQEEIYEEMFGKDKEED